MDGNLIKKIKVIRIIARLNIGGPAINTILLTEGLDKNKFDSLLVTGRTNSNEGDMQYYAESKNIVPLVIPQLQREINFISDLIALIKLYFLIKRKDPDIIHTHTAKAGALGRIAGLVYNLINRKNKCLLIHTFHGTVLQGYFGKSKSSFFIWIERFLAYFTDRIVVVGKVIKEELLNLRIGTSEKIYVVPLGLELQDLLGIPLGKTSSTCRFGMVGRLVPVKNHRLFLEAIKAFTESYAQNTPFCHFYIIGDGELRKKLQTHSSFLGIECFINFCGWNFKPTGIYDSLDAVVLTSLNEGTPVSLIEAMSAAKPVIATNVGGVRDLFIKNQEYGLGNTNRIRVYDNGILCESQDAQGLAEAFHILATNPELREKMGESGREFVKDRFSKDRLIKDIEMLYNNCLKRSN